jgi:hypothetical protein
MLKFLLYFNILIFMLSNKADYFLELGQNI